VNSVQPDATFGLRESQRIRIPLSVCCDTDPAVQAVSSCKAVPTSNGTCLILSPMYSELFPHALDCLQTALNRLFLGIVPAQQSYVNTEFF